MLTTKLLELSYNKRQIVFDSSICTYIHRACFLGLLKGYSQVHHEAQMCTKCKMPFLDTLVKAAALKRLGLDSPITSDPASKTILHLSQPAKKKKKFAIKNMYFLSTWTFYKNISPSALKAPAFSQSHRSKNH